LHAAAFYFMGCQLVRDDMPTISSSIVCSSIHPTILLRKLKLFYLHTFTPYIHQHDTLHHCHKGLWCKESIIYIWTINWYNHYWVM